MSEPEVTHVTTAVVPVAQRLPAWATLVRAPNPGPMTLDGTNTWVLRAPDAAEAVVVDPGPAHEGHLRAVAGHGPVAGVLVTHGHPDHVEGLDRFCELASGTSKRSCELASGTSNRSCELASGTSKQGRELSGAPVELDPGRAGLVITVLATPGHTADSVCYLVEAGGERAILTGDTILGRGTAVVAWPDGDLGAYLSSLQRLAELGPLPALPGHGPALADCAAAASYYLAHRRARLAQVRAALAAGATTPADVVSAAYPDIDPSLRPAAEWSVRAQLAYLHAENRECDQGLPPLDVP